MKSAPTKILSSLPKVDLYQIHKAEYLAKTAPALIEMKPAQYLAIDGGGAPGGPAFSTKIGALYGVAFTVKMTWKFAGFQDYAVGKMEGLWFVDKEKSMPPKNPEDWRWKLMIRTPEFIGQKEVESAVEVLLKKGKDAAVKEVKIETLKEGRCVQMLHRGPYDQEKETISMMLDYAKIHGLRLVGPHHEIYISDPRRVPPERLKTILREPVAPL